MKRSLALGLSLLSSTAFATTDKLLQDELKLAFGEPELVIVTNVSVSGGIISTESTVVFDTTIDDKQYTGCKAVIENNDKVVVIEEGCFEKDEE